MRGILSYLLLTAVRDRLLVGLGIALLLSYAGALFIGQTALVEEAQTMRALAAGTVRFILVVGMIVLVCFHTRQLMMSKEIGFLLTRPLSRGWFVVSSAAGYALIALGISFLVALGCLPLGYKDFGSFGLWAGSLMAEAVLVTIVAYCFSLLLQNAVSACLAAGGFYLFSRIAILLVSTAESPMSKTHTLFDQLAYWGMYGLSLLFPRLDLFARSEWLVYGQPEVTMGFILAQTGIYAGVLMMICIIDFRRKEL